jgi:hypothetical protein
MLTGWSWGQQRKGDHFDDLVTGGWIILKWIFKYEGKCGTILSGLNRTKWQPRLNVVMVFLVP